MNFNTLRTIVKCLNDDTVIRPHCGAEETIVPEEREDLCTLHGTENPVPITCMDCDGEIIVKEHVLRHYTVENEDDDT